jgi:hypothetical protein
MASKEQVIQAVETSLKRLVTDDEYLLRSDVNERSLSHQFAIYLQEEVTRWSESWNVDCEYNRDIEGGEDYSKTLDLSADELDHFHPSFEDEHASTVFPDVIVHQRGKPGSSGGNLIVIEMKKTSSRDNGTFDKTIKLPRYCSQLGYRYAAFVMLETRGQPNYKLDWIRLPNNGY